MRRLAKSLGWLGGGVTSVAEVVGAGVVLSALVTAAINWLGDFPLWLLICLFLGLCLLVSAAFSRTLTWFYQRRVLSRIDSSCRYVLLSREAIEVSTSLHPPEVIAPFTPPPEYRGGFVSAPSYGPFSVSEARAAFAKLEQLRLIDPIGPPNPRTGFPEYQWTVLGRRIVAKIRDEDVRPTE